MSWIKSISGGRKEISQSKVDVSSSSKTKSKPKQRFIDDNNRLNIEEKYINRLKSQSDRAVAKFLSGRTPVGRLEKKFKGDAVTLKLLTQLVNENPDTIIKIERQLKADGILELKSRSEFPIQHFLKIFYPKLEKLDDELADHEIMRGVEDFERLENDLKFLEVWKKDREYLETKNSPKNPEVPQKGQNVPETATPKVDQQEIPQETMKTDHTEPKEDQIEDFNPDTSNISGLDEDLPQIDWQEPLPPQTGTRNPDDDPMLLEIAYNQIRDNPVPIPRPLTREQHELMEKFARPFSVREPIEEVIESKDSLQEQSGLDRASSESAPPVKPHGDIHKPDCSLLQNDPVPIEPDVFVDGREPQLKSSQEQSSQSMVLPGDIPDPDQHRQVRLRSQVREKPQEIDRGIQQKTSPEDLKEAGASASKDAPVITTEQKVSKPLDKLDGAKTDEVVKQTVNNVEEKTGPVETKTGNKPDEPSLKLDSGKKTNSGSWFSRTWSNIKYAFHNWSIKAPGKIKADRKLELKQSQIDMMRPGFDDRIMQNLLAGKLDIKTERNVLLKLAETEISDVNLDRKLKGMKIFSPEGEYAKVAMRHVETYRNSLTGTEPYKFDKTADEYLRIARRFIEEVSLNMKKHDIRLEEKRSYA